MKNQEYFCMPAKEITEKSKAGKVYVIQEHAARKLHWDLRLEIDGVLKSWTVPKEPPSKEGEKRLAIQTDDHSLSYKDFEGIIEEGNYGAGEVEIWDRGEFTAEELKDGKIVFKIKGKKLNGTYCLIKTSFGKNSWLFFKKRGIRK